MSSVEAEALRDRCVSRTAWGTLEDDRVVGLPVLGRIAADSDHCGRNHESTLMTIDCCLCGNVFALVVKGDSMIEDGIFDGDYVRPSQAHLS